ncbi:hypothetical protein [Pseudoduganella lurida]|uniref:hypothetical protein n=1 Tax=Pseudoduganella lurida TaxID=1036180 RepID=UPI0013151E31|nr:hypothetical protein [Pseudoduganella lurida]
MVILGNGMTHSGAAGTQLQRQGDETAPGNRETPLDGRENRPDNAKSPASLLGF